MALSVGSLGASSGITTTRPMNYTIRNNSQVSASFAETLRQVSAVGASRGIDAVSPVGYANAQRQTVNPVGKLQQAQEANAKFNEVAAGFAGAITGYGSDSMASGYAMVGSTLDLFA